MAGQVEIYQEIVIVDEEGVRHTFGDRARQVTRALGAGRLACIQHSVAAQTTRLLWQASTAAEFSSFRWAMLRARGLAAAPLGGSEASNLELEVQCDEDGTVGTVAMTFPLVADVWFQIHNDRASLAGNTGDFNGTADVIDKLQVRNTHATDAGSIELVLAL